MNKELKFKAWDKKNKRFITEEDLDEYVWIDLDGTIWQWNEDDWIENPENIVVIQFTGLKDKNGKEIYEADIIKNEDGSITEVEFIEIGLMADFYMVGFSLGGRQNRNQELEVIGNKFENKELLENETTN